MINNFNKSNHFIFDMPFKLCSIPVLFFILIFSWGCGTQNKKDASDFFLKANVQLNKNNYEEAIRLYDEALDKFP